MAGNRPMIRSVLAHTIEIAQVNFLPMALLAFVSMTPFLSFVWRENFMTLLSLVEYKTVVCLFTAISWAATTLLFYGAISGAHGQRLGFRDCAVKGVRFALPIVLPVFILGFGIGATFGINPLAGIAVTIAFSLTAITLAVERCGILRAVRRLRTNMIEQPVLVSGTILAISGCALGHDAAVDLYGDLYIFVLGRIWHELVRLTSPFVAVLLPCAQVALYVAIRRHKDGVEIKQSLPLPT